MLNARIGGVFIPDWLAPLLGERERRICRAPDVQVLCVNQDGALLKPHQRLIESQEMQAWFVIDSHTRQIVG